MSEAVEARCNLKHHEQHERHERECATCGLHGEVCVGCTERFVGAEGCARRRRQLWRGGSLARRRGMAWQDGWRMRCGSDAPNSEYDGRGVPRVGTSVPRVAKLRVPCPQGTIGVPKLYTWYILSIMIRSMYFFSGRFCCTQHEGRIKLVSTARSGRHQEAGEAIYSG